MVAIGEPKGEARGGGDCGGPKVASLEWLVRGSCALHGEDIARDSIDARSREEFIVEGIQLGWEKAMIGIGFDEGGICLEEFPEAFAFPVGKLPFGLSGEEILKILGVIFLTHDGR